MQNDNNIVKNESSPTGIIDDEFVEEGSSSIDNVEKVSVWLRVWRIIKNRYVAALLVFLILWLGGSKNNYFVSRRLSKQVRELKATEKSLREEAKRDSIQSELLLHDMDAMERYGREHYYMREEGEDVFVVNTSH